MQIHDHFGHELISKYSDTGHMFSVKMCPQSHHHVRPSQIFELLMPFHTKLIYCVLEIKYEPARKCMLTDFHKITVSCPEKSK